MCDKSTTLVRITNRCSCYYVINMTIRCPCVMFYRAPLPGSHRVVPFRALQHKFLQPSKFSIVHSHALPHINTALRLILCNVHFKAVQTHEQTDAKTWPFSGRHAASMQVKCHSIKRRPDAFSYAAKCSVYNVPR